MTELTDGQDYIQLWEPNLSKKNNLGRSGSNRAAGSVQYWTEAMIQKSSGALAIKINEESYNLKEGRIYSTLFVPKGPEIEGFIFHGRAPEVASRDGLAKLEQGIDDSIF